MTVPEDIKDLNAMADKLLKDKIEKVTPVPMDAHEAILLDTIHVIGLPTMTEIYKEVGLQLLKYAIGIGLFLAGWWLFSCILDEVAIALGY